MLNLINRIVAFLLFFIPVTVHSLSYEQDSKSLSDHLWLQQMDVVLEGTIREDFLYTDKAKEYNLDINRYRHILVVDVIQYWKTKEPHKVVIVAIPEPPPPLNLVASSKVKPAMPILLGGRITKNNSHIIQANSFHSVKFDGTFNDSVMKEIQRVNQALGTNRQIISLPPESQELPKEDSLHLP
jgi:hypothetical protein